jgi:general stress protein YciG
MDRRKQREIAGMGGKAAHMKGTAHQWTSDEAKEAGRKGGIASHRRKQQRAALALVNTRQMHVSRTAAVGSSRVG